MGRALARLDETLSSLIWASSHQMPFPGLVGVLPGLRVTCCSSVSYNLNHSEQHFRLFPNGLLISQGDTCPSPTPLPLPGLMHRDTVGQLTYFSSRRGYGTAGCPQEVTTVPKVAALRCILSVQDVIPHVNCQQMPECHVSLPEHWHDLCKLSVLQPATEFPQGPAWKQTAPS